MTVASFALPVPGRIYTLLPDRSIAILLSLTNPSALSSLHEWHQSAFKCVRLVPFVCVVFMNFSAMIVLILALWPPALSKILLFGGPLASSLEAEMVRPVRLLNGWVWLLLPVHWFLSMTRSVVLRPGRRKQRSRPRETAVG